MNRKVFLYLLLAVIAISCVLVVASLFNSALWAMTGRVIGSLFLCCIFSYRATVHLARLDRPETALSGQAGVVVSLFQLGLLLLALWALSLHLLFIAILVAPTLWVAVRILDGQKLPGMPFSHYFGSASMLVAFALGAFTILFGGYNLNWLHEPFWLIGLMVWYFGLTGAMCMAGWKLSGPKLGHIRWAGFVFAMLGLGYSIVSIFSKSSFFVDDRLHQVLICMFSSGAALCGYVNTVIQTNMVGWQRAVRGVAIGLAALATCALNYLVAVGEFNKAFGDYLPFTVCLCFVLLAFTLSVLVLHRINAVKTPAPVDPVEASIVFTIRMECPRCTRQINAKPSEGKCDGCGLEFNVTFEPPRCRKCNYILQGQAHKACPECGEPVQLPGRQADGTSSQVTPAGG